ncbi:MAG: DUF2281 domain-containing protein [Ignavibacteriaceae bacterium]|jgi:hypothetical protein|nr:DUF2281 domain-containing protein [Ignavibacteriaceae bacterium]
MEKYSSYQQKVNELPEYLRKNVELYIDFLLEKQKPKKRTKLKQTWAGSLKQFNNEYSSVELQKLALKWRN